MPAGNSWGVAVPAGTSRNVVADPPGFDHTAPHLVVGAHLDSVPQSPGAEDNASGVAVMLELARMLAEQPGGPPVRFIAFGAEEPRGEGDDWHHYGSQHYVAGLGEADQAAIVAMVALAPPSCGNSWSRRRAGSPSWWTSRTAPATIGRSTRPAFPRPASAASPFPGYHSPGDTPDMVDEQQLGPVGGIMWNWLQAHPM